MSDPVRIQLRRTKGWRLPEGAVSVARPTKWGNPYRVGEAHYLAHESGGVFTAETAVATYREMVENSPGLIDEIRYHLAGHDLACWCPLDQPCHADVLIEIANANDHPTDNDPASTARTTGS